MATIEEKELEQMQALNDALAVIDTLAPLVPIEDVGEGVTPEMLHGLAQAYGLEGFRKFLAHFVNRQMKLTAMKSLTMVDQAAGKARTLIVKEILSQGRKAYMDQARIAELQRGGKK